MSPGRSSTPWSRGDLVEQRGRQGAPLVGRQAIAACAPGGARRRAARRGRRCRGGKVLHAQPTDLGVGFVVGRPVVVAVLGVPHVAQAVPLARILWVEAVQVVVLAAAQADLTCVGRARDAKNGLAGRCSGKSRLKHAPRRDESRRPRRAARR